MNFGIMNELANLLGAYGIEYKSEHVSAPGVYRKDHIIVHGAAGEELSIIYADGFDGEGMTYGYPEEVEYWLRTKDLEPLGMSDPAPASIEHVADVARRIVYSEILQNL